jgi:hypothetical protein
VAAAAVVVFFLVDMAGSSSVAALSASSVSYSLSLPKLSVVKKRIRDVTYTREEKHLSSGGNPYSQDMREEVIARHQLGLPIVTPELTALRQQYKYSSVWMCWRYIRQFNASGHARPKYATGNHMAERQVLGQHLVRLALFRIVHLEGTIVEARTFLLNMDPTIVPRSPQNIVLICGGRHRLTPVRERTGK